jgi:hypothetical protein
LSRHRPMTEFDPAETLAAKVCCDAPPCRDFERVEVIPFADRAGPAIRNAFGNRMLSATWRGAA